MSVYYTCDEALNRPEIPEEWIESIITGRNEVCQFICNLVIQHIRSSKKVCVAAFDGFPGVEWESIIPNIEDLLQKRGLSSKAIDIRSCYKPTSEIEEMVKPSLTNDPHFGFVFPGKLKDFFDTAHLDSVIRKIKEYKRKKGRENSIDVLICYGTGAVLPALRGLSDFSFYVDITREELLKRLEKKTAFPLGCQESTISDSLLPRRLSYVDYQVLKLHKKYILKYMDWYIDGNNPENPKLLSRDVYEGILSILAHYPFRLKPLYIPRIWGGKYMLKIRNLPMEACAFVIEVLPSEQNVRILVGNTILEIPFLNVVWAQPINILGRKSVEKFGAYFPLTLNYDDTYQGGSLAIQVHPNGRYMKSKFNEFMRHDESYYVVKAWEGAKTYHGFKEDTDLDELRRLGEESEQKKIPFDHDLYINSWQSEVGDLFLLPAGTVHASGENQLVLEIDFDGSKNGQEYTFHLYDYLRPDLEGKLRAIHIDHFFNVVRPYRKTKWVADNLKQSPRAIRSGEGWAEYLLGERHDMDYKVHRLEFQKKIEDDTRGTFHALVLVEGERVIVRSNEHPEKQFQVHYTESVIIPASLGSYSVINQGRSFCKLTKALLK